MDKTGFEQTRENDFQFIMEALDDRHAHAAFLEGMMNSFESALDVKSCEGWTQEYIDRVARQMEVVRGEIFALYRLGRIIKMGEVFEERL